MSRELALWASNGGDSMSGMEAVMSNLCTACGFDNSNVRASLRREIVQCEGCEEWLCLECLAGSAEKVGMGFGGEDAQLVKCSASDLWLCPECFEDKEED